MPPARSASAAHLLRRIQSPTADCPRAIPANRVEQSRIRSRSVRLRKARSIAAVAIRLFLRSALARCQRRVALLAGAIVGPFAARSTRQSLPHLFEPPNRRGVRRVSADRWPGWPCKKIRRAAELTCRELSRARAPSSPSPEWLMTSNNFRARRADNRLALQPRKAPALPVPWRGSRHFQQPRDRAAPTPSHRDHKVQRASMNSRIKVVESEVVMKRTLSGSPGQSSPGCPVRGATAPLPGDFL